MILLVAAGGAGGSVLRYVTGFILSNLFGTSWPYGTIAVNLSGSFLIGLAASFLAMRCPDPRLAAFFIAGFLGGFTTFSSLMNETMQFLIGREWAPAASYLLLQTGGGLAAAALGIALFHFLAA